MPNDMSYPTLADTHYIEYIDDSEYGLFSVMGSDELIFAKNELATHSLGQTLPTVAPSGFGTVYINLVTGFLHSFLAVFQKKGIVVGLTVDNIYHRMTSIDCLNSLNFHYSQCYARHDDFSYFFYAVKDTKISSLAQLKILLGSVFYVCLAFSVNRLIYEYAQKAFGDIFFRGKGQIGKELYRFFSHFDRGDRLPQIGVVCTDEVSPNDLPAKLVFMVLFRVFFDDGQAIDGLAGVQMSDFENLSDDLQNEWAIYSNQVSPRFIVSALMIN